MLVSFMMDVQIFLAPTFLALVLISLLYSSSDLLPIGRGEEALIRFFGWLSHGRNARSISPLTFLTWIDSSLDLLVKLPSY